MNKLYPLLLIFCACFGQLIAQNQIDTLLTNLFEPARIIAGGDLLYFTQDDMITTYDLSAANPQAEILYSGNNVIADMVLLGTDLYFAEFNNGNIQRLDLTVSPPTATTVISGQFGVNGLIEQDSVFYFTRSQNNSLHRYDLTSDAPMVELLVSGSIGFPGPLEINGDQLYVSCLLGDSLALVDLSNDPLVSEALVAPIDLPVGQLLVGDQLYVGSSNNGMILIFDVNDFSMVPDTIGDFGGPSDMVLVDGNLYVVDFEADQLLRVNLQLAGEQCSNAIAVDELFGQATGEAQTSGIYDNTDYNADGDPDFGFECFMEVNAGGGTDFALDNSIFFSFTGDGNTYQIAAPPCNATNPIAFNDSQIALYSGDCGNLTAVACNEDEQPLSSFVAAVTVETEVGVQYYFLVDGFSDAVNNILPTGEFCVEVTNLTVSSVTDLQDISASLFPNPTSGLLQLPAFEVQHVSVFNLKGSRVADFSRPGNNIDLAHLPTGTYALRLTDADGQFYSARVVKQ